MTITGLRLQAVTLEIEGFAFVSDLDSEVRSGQISALTGPSGSGKSALLHAIAGLHPLSRGQILVDGHPAVLWREQALGLVLQNLGLVPVLSAQETVALPLQARGWPRPLIGDRSMDELARFGLDERASQLVAHLSGGQQQRVAIARALAGDPDVILADEPVSALDDHWRAVVLDRLRAHARRGAAIIIATSDVELVAACDQVVRLPAA